MSNFIAFTKRACIVGALCWSGCAPVDEDFAPEDGRDVEVDGIQSEVRLGASGGGVGTVEIGGCSGSLVGTRMVITAAHCFDSDLGSATSGTANRRIALALTGTSWKCISGTAQTPDGKCAAGASVHVRRLSGSRPEQDLAVVFAGSAGAQFANAAPGDGIDGLYAGPMSAGNSYVFYGAGYYHWNGTGDGVMRYMTDTIDWVGSEHFVTDADNVRVCRGDSGGTYFLSGGGRWQFAVHSSSNHSSQCAEVGEKVRFTRINMNKINAINGFRSARFVAGCTAHSPQFPNFFVCS